MLLLTWLLLGSRRSWYFTLHKEEFLGHSLVVTYQPEMDFSAWLLYFQVDQKCGIFTHTESVFGPFVFKRSVDLLKDFTNRK